MKQSTFKLAFSVLLVMSSLFSVAQTNQYLHFDGIDDYTELPNAAQYVNNSNTVTMAGWFYTDALTYGQGMMGIRGGGTGAGEMYLIQLANGTVECRVITDTGLHQFVAPEGTLQAGVWQHVAWVFDQTTVEFFVDGESIGSSTASGTMQSTTRPFALGKSIQAGFNFVFKGGIDEVSLWSKALSQAEIQDMMANELTGTETNLEVYYKFNQGAPGGNNTAITMLLDESGDPARHSVLNNFALIGETSNFVGELQAGQQAINFPPIPNKLITDAPFVLEATATSGLPVAYEIVSGPATVSGTTLTLNGTAGTVTVKASQQGDGMFDPAPDVTVNFEVLDPQDVLVETDVLHPLAGDVYAPSLIPLQVAVKAGIEYPELFSVASVEAVIDGTPVTLTDHENGYYTGWWTPTAHGSFDVEISATNNFGVLHTQTQSINVVQSANDQSALATDEAWVYGDVPSVTQTATLPSHIGAFDKIIGNLVIDCPPGGCDPWDRVSTVEAQGKDGQWYEIIRYLTPYGVACNSEIDLTDFASLLQGKTNFRVNLGTQGNGFEYTLQLNYEAGVPDHPYSTVTKLWYQTYQFGDPANLQPAEQFDVVYPENTETAKIKLVSSGHGWGDNNTGNAAEFHQDTHHIWVDNAETFEQFNWVDCDPNPDGCSPQNGTWYFNRAGWCPGSIAQFFDYDMAPYTNQDQVRLRYVFDTDYVDNCHPNNDDCVSGTTCPNCDDGFNPHLIVSSYLISLGDAPLGDSEVILGTEDYINPTAVSVYPNPSGGQFYVSFDAFEDASTVKIYDYLGRPIQQHNVAAGNGALKVNLTNYATGIYLVSVQNKKGDGVIKRVIIE
ncbi:MAG: hypothetical protein CMC70_00095 [Flavobacteriaceae bacterium]|nr:hypothetical protein [Flavobacteriaceae bacterium]